MKASIIIPTYGRPKVFKDCLDSIEKFAEAKKFEVVIVNNNNSILLRKETSKVCRRSKLNVVEIVTKRAVGSVEARNLGIKNSKGEILFFFDDDTIIQAGYFNKILACYNDKRVGAAGGAEIKAGQSLLHKLFFKFNKPGSISWCGEIISNFSQDYPACIEVKHLHGSNFSIRKSVIGKIGLMDAKMEWHYRDETEFTYRVYAKGYKVLFEPGARVIHKVSSIGGNIDQSKKQEWAYWYHRNTSYFFFKHLYKGNVLKLACYVAREFLMSIVRSVLYGNIFYLLEFASISEGYRLNRSKSKSTSI